jgi:hypothetical protein
LESTATSAAARALALPLAILGFALVFYGFDCLVTQKASLPSGAFMPQSWTRKTALSVAGLDAVVLGCGYVALGGLMSGVVLFRLLANRFSFHPAFLKAGAVSALVVFDVTLFFVLARILMGLAVWSL